MSHIDFQSLGLPPIILSALHDLGYEHPTPVQAKSIPILLSKQDLLAQAQTGTGKTAAFALPMLANIHLPLKAPQALIIAPTRELAMQVAEACQSYSKYLKGLKVTPIFGGQDYRTQLQALKSGSHVIVGTPGRIMDHMRKGSLSLDHLKLLVLDEADEMLKMGFIDDIEWILEHVPEDHQTGLFSATMPPQIQKITKKYLNNPEHVFIKPEKQDVAQIEQCCLFVDNKQKTDLLLRFLEAEVEMDASIIFTRTKSSTELLADQLKLRGHRAAALNGDMAQASRQKVIERMKKGSLDIVVATDVAARGIDIVRITHVFNYDIPFDEESYVHRIGRTGRAGRTGKALLFVTPRETRLLRDIERVTSSKIERINPPSIQMIKEKRASKLAGDIVSRMQNEEQIKPYRDLIKSIMAEKDCSPEDVAAVVLYMLQKNNPLPKGEIRIVEPMSGGYSKSNEGRSRPRRGGGSWGDKKPGGFKRRAEGSRDGFDKRKRSTDKPAFERGERSERNDRSDRSGDRRQSSEGYDKKKSFKPSDKKPAFKKSFDKPAGKFSSKPSTRSSAKPADKPVRRVKKKF